MLLEPSVVSVAPAPAHPLHSAVAPAPAANPSHAETPTPSAAEPVASPRGPSPTAVPASTLAPVPAWPPCPAAQPSPSVGSPASSPATAQAARPLASAPSRWTASDGWAHHAWETAAHPAPEAPDSSATAAMPEPRRPATRRAPVEGYPRVRNPHPHHTVRGGHVPDTQGKHPPR
jgi:hypothetical protein